MFDVITIGTATRDVFLISPYFKAIRDPDLKKKGFVTGEAEYFTLGGKIEIDNITMATGGGATNAAITFARQGFKTASLFKVGNDSAGREITNELRREKVTILNSKKDNEKNNKNSARGTMGTAYSTILLTPSGEQTILVYRGISGDLSNKEIFFSKFASKWAYVAPGKISFDVIKKIFNNLRRNGILIAFNPSKDYLKMGLKKIMPLFNQCQVIIMNREEAAYLTKIDYDNEKKIFQRLEAAVKGIMVMTDGRNGVWVSSCHSRESLPRSEFALLRGGNPGLCHSRESGNPAFGKNIFQAETFIEKKIMNHTGAGDAFGSGFVAGLMRRPGLNPIDIEYAIRLGAANATSVIEKIGAKTGILTKKEFEQNKRWKKLKISRKF